MRISPGLRRLLESGGHVDGVAGDEALTRCRIAGDDLAGVHADRIAILDPVVALELLVEVRERVVHRRGGPDGAEGIVLVELRDAEDGHDGIADVLLDVPPWGSIAAVIVSKYRACTRRSASGSSRSPIASRTGHVGEDDGDDLADLARRFSGRRQGRTAGLAEPGSLGVRLGARRADPHRCIVVPGPGPGETPGSRIRCGGHGRGPAGASARRDLCWMPMGSRPRSAKR